MLVVDASALLDSVLAEPRDTSLQGRINGEGLHAPHLIDVEAVNALRRMVRAGRLTVDRASSVLGAIAVADITRYSHEPLRRRMWELRDNVAAYDAAYVALAEMLGAPLVTTDGRLARSSGHQAVIEDFSSPS